MTDADRERIRRSRILLQDPYAYVGEDDGYEADFEPPTRPQVVRLDPTVFRSGKTHGQRLRRPEIEAIARDVQLALWHAAPRANRDNPLDVVDPIAALRSFRSWTNLVVPIGASRELSVRSG